MRILWNMAFPIRDPRATPGPPVCVMRPTNIFVNGVDVFYKKTHYNFGGYAYHLSFLEARPAHSDGGGPLSKEGLDARDL
jgi:hypothetical protein